MPNLGDIAYQTVAGATSTSTHGTGARLTGLADQIVGLRLVTADGSIVSCSADEEPEVFRVARVGLGALGIVSTVTLQVVPAFTLQVVEEPMRVDAVLADLDAHVDGNDHFEFFWVPHTGWALTKTNNRSDEPLAPRPRWKEWRDDLLLENYAFGAVCRLGRLRPRWIPKLAKALPSSGRTTYIDKSYRVFASTRLVRFYEMEYAIPREACAEALNRVRAFVEDEGLLLSFPVEVRFTAPDDIPLSTGTARPAATSPCTCSRAWPTAPTSKASRPSWTTTAGGPHWGKLHFQTAATLAPRYPAWDRFQAMRARLDPEGRFANAYTRRVLGSPERRTGPRRRVAGLVRQVSPRARGPRRVTSRVARRHGLGAVLGAERRLQRGQQRVDPLLSRRRARCAQPVPGRRRRTKQRGRRLRPTRQRHRGRPAPRPAPRWRALRPAPRRRSGPGAAPRSRWWHRPRRATTRPAVWCSSTSNSTRPAPSAPWCDVVEDRPRLLGPAGAGQELGSQQAAAGQADVVVALAREPLTGIEGRQRGFEVAAPLVDPACCTRGSSEVCQTRRRLVAARAWSRWRWRDVELGSMTVQSGQVELDTSTAGARRRAGAGRSAAPRRGGPWPRRTRRA